MNDLVVGWIAAVLGWFAYRVWQMYRERFSQQVVKFTYFRVIRLRFRDRGDEAFYERKHHTLKDHTEPVFDETWTMNSIQTRVPEIIEPVQVSSSGVVDAMQLLPHLDHDVDNHPHSRGSADVFTFANPEKNTNVTAVGTLVNGLQHATDWWFGTTAQYDGQTLILVVDFSSLPIDRGIVHGVTAALERNRANVPKASVESQWFEDQLGDDIFYLKFTNAKKQDVIKFNFQVDQTRLPITNSNRTTALRDMTSERAA
ncbi:MAG: hypothetical protein AAF745_03195 [Planctomycetota bacterium]